jgi:hypothetical protein
MAVDALARLLKTLREEGSVPESAISESQREELDSLFRFDILERRPAGRGFRVHVTHEQSFERFIQQHYPEGLEADETDPLPPKAAAIAERGDSKRSASHETRPVLVRGFDGLLLHDGPDPYRVAELTDDWGLAALAVDDDLELGCSDRRLVLVENFESFMHVEHVFEALDLALYTSGVLPDVAIRWLDRAFEDCQFVHFADYDPKGLSEYERLRETLGPRLDLHVPDDLDDLLETYGKRALLEDSPDLLDSLRQSDLPEVRELARRLHRHGRGLEQEALLIEAMRENESS